MTFKTKVTIFVIVLIAILSAATIYEFNLIKQKNKQIVVAAQNLAASQDNIRLTKDRLGKEEADKLSYLTTKITDLQKVNADLANEVKITKGTVNEVSKIVVKVVHDTVQLNANTIATDSTIRSDFKFDSTFSPGNFRTIEGYTFYNLKTKKTFGLLTKDRFGVNLITGIKNLNKGKPEIFVRSDYPGFTVTQLEGAILDPSLFAKQKTPLLTLGITIGLTPVTYDIDKKIWSINTQRIGATLGLQFNIGRLLNKKQ